MRLLSLVVLLLFAGGLSAGYPVSYRPTYSYPETVYKTVYVAESVLVPVVVPSALLVNLAPATVPPPVTIAPQALVDAQNVNTAMLQRMEALERKLDQLLTPQMPRADAAAVVPAKPTIAQAAGVLKQHCAQCHTGDQARGDVRLFDASGAYHPAVPASVILAAVRGDRMPKGPVKLSAQEKALLEAWAKP